MHLQTGLLVIFSIIATAIAAPPVCNRVDGARKQILAATGPTPAPQSQVPLANDVTYDTCALDPRSRRRVCSTPQRRYQNNVGPTRITSNKAQLDAFAMGTAQTVVRDTVPTVTDYPANNTAIVHLIAVRFPPSLCRRSTTS